MKGGRGSKRNAPLDAATSGEGQGIKDMTIISQEAKECKR